MIIVEFSQAACITVNGPRTFHIGYLFLQEMCTELQLDKLCPVIRGRYKFKYDFHVVLRNTHYRMFRGHYLRSLGNLFIQRYRTKKEAVYTIVLYEKSPEIFKKHSERYIYEFRQRTDIDMDINLLQRYVFVSLDIFINMLHNRGITSKLEAWLTFLASDVPEDIIMLMQTYPEFKVLYEDVYAICTNTEKVMNMFSKELAQLDKNTVQYMIDEMQDEIDGMHQQLEEKNREFAEVISEKDREIMNVINEKDREIAMLREKLKSQGTHI